MPIEIRELVIKTRVEDTPASNATTSGSENKTGANMSAQQLEDLVEIVLERMMEVLKQQNER